MDYKTEKFSVTGMTCGACAAHVERTVRKLKGIKSVSVNLLFNSMVVEYGQDYPRAEDIVDAVKKAGYGAELKLDGAIKSKGKEGLDKNRLTDNRANKNNCGFEQQKSDCVLKDGHSGFEQADVGSDMDGAGACPVADTGHLERQNNKNNPGFEQADVGSDMDGAGDCPVADTGHLGRQNTTNNSKQSSTKNSKQSTKVLKASKNNLLSRLAASAGLLLPLMYVSMGHMLKLPLPSFLHGHKNIMLIALTQFFLSLAVVLLNKAYFIGGFRAILRRAPNMDSLVAIGSGAAFVYSIVCLFIMGYFLGRGNLDQAAKYGSDLYFESAAMILTLVTVGKFLEARSKGRTRDAIFKLMDLSPKTATVIRDGAEVVLPIEQLIKGDIVVVRPGGSIPADGIIIEGNCSVDESAVTGESLPVDKAQGDRVTAATINKSGYIKFRAERVGGETTISQIIRLIEDANSGKAPVAKLADRVSGFFVPAVMAAALVSVIVWIIAGKAVGFALSMGIAVLVISCPCALGLATPTAIMVGTGRGAELGILFKTAEGLENAHKADVVILDKTGTVTAGKPVVTDIVAANDISKDRLLMLAASAEKLSEHPLAQAVVRYCEDSGISLLPAVDFIASEGRGISAILDGSRVYVGNLRMLEQHADLLNNCACESEIEGMDTACLHDIKGDSTICGQSKSDEIGTGTHTTVAEVVRQGKQLEYQGKTVLFVFNDNKILGLLAVADTVKPDSAAAVAMLKRLGLKVVMLTGDNIRTAQAIAVQTGIDSIKAGLMPADKESEVRRYQAEGKRVAVVGDGINDAPALARADTGIAIGAGTDIAIDSADIVLISDKLFSVATALALSRATLRNIKQNLFWAFFYNIICIPLAAGVFYPLFNIKLDPMVAAAAMSLSSVFVVLNALRLKFFKDYSKKDRCANVDMDNEKFAKDILDNKCANQLDIAASDKYNNTAAASNPKDNVLESKKIKTAKNKSHFKEDKVKKIIMIKGMSCGHCSARVENALSALAGVKAKADHKKGRAEVVAESDICDEQLRTAVKNAGYEVTGIKED